MGESIKQPLSEKKNRDHPLTGGLLIYGINGQDILWSGLHLLLCKYQLFGGSVRRGSTVLLLFRCLQKNQYNLGIIVPFKSHMYVFDLGTYM